MYNISRLKGIVCVHSITSLRRVAFQTLRSYPRLYFFPPVMISEYLHLHSLRLLEQHARSELSIVYDASYLHDGFREILFVRTRVRLSRSPVQIFSELQTQSIDTCKYAWTLVPCRRLQPCRTRAVVSNHNSTRWSAGYYNATDKYRTCYRNPQHSRQCSPWSESR